MVKPKSLNLLFKLAYSEAFIGKYCILSRLFTINGIIIFIYLLSVETTFC